MTGSRTKYGSFALLITMSLAALCAAQARSSRIEPPPPMREFRAAWVATVGNIDWPSKPGLSTEDQQREVIRILDRAVSLKLNVMVLQVRTSADALYDSKLEPWSEYLTGKQGQAPNPYYDPLKFWIDECHKRGIELHAWFNPFRAQVAFSNGTTTKPSSKSRLAQSHLGNTHPEWVKEYGHYLWLDPGVQAAQDHTFSVFMDVVKRYDVDGIHIDDYFYPYPEKVNEKDEDDDRVIPFPDEDSYKASGGKMKLADWRRDNIDKLMKRLYFGIKAEKKWVKFGISPFGIARPGKPAYVKGFDQYDKLYADAEKWLKEGWCDYLAPQLYWATGAPNQPYLGLLQWWTQNNPKHRHIYGGLFTSRIDGSEKSWCPSEIAGQVMITRLVEGTGGNVHFSMMALTQNRAGIGDLLRNGVYSGGALVPASTWLDSDPPPAPRDLAVENLTPEQTLAALPINPADSEPNNHPTTRPAKTPFMPLTTQPSDLAAKLVKRGGIRVTWKPAGRGEEVWQYTVYAKQGDDWVMQVLPARSTQAVFRDSGAKSSATTIVAVAAVDRSGNESSRTILQIKGAAEAKGK
jgi:uncharacterized lipoprotein YddW (UPF0748 family)